MKSEERALKYQEQTRQIYAAIGQFAVKFEQVCFAMQSGIIFMLHKDGLKNQRIGEAILAQMTAEPLRLAWISVIQETCKQLSDNDKKIIQMVAKRLQNLIMIRNNILHRMWFVGWASEGDTDFSHTSGTKFKNTANGIEHRPEHYSAADFDKHSEEADELNKIVSRLTGAILSNLKIGKNFILDGNTVKLPPGC